MKRIPSPLAAGVVMAPIGVLAWAVAMPWLSPSLGPTIAIQSEFADQPVARPWNVVAGHIADLRGIGVLAAGIALVAVLGEGVRRLRAAR